MEFTDENGNMIEIDENDDRHDELYEYISCLKEIKKGNIINIGCISFEDDDLKIAIKKLQCEFWSAMLSGNFDTITDDLNY